MWKLTIEDEQGSSTVVPLVRHEYTLGRTEENSIRLTERNVSRKHARLLKKNARWFLFDDSSYNGCFVNGARIINPVALGPRDLIQIADYRLEIDSDDQRDLVATGDDAKLSDTLSNTPHALAAQSDRLVMVVGPTPGRDYILGKTRQSIGRGEENDICVNHASVSRRHAEISYVSDGRYEIVDQNSSNGLSINGVALSRGILDARDIVELGDIVLKFIPAGDAYRPSPEETEQLTALLGMEEEGEAQGFVERARSLLSTISRPMRYAILALSALVAGLFVAAAIRVQKKPADTTATTRLASVASEASSPSPIIEARGRLDRGDADGAHELLSRLAEGDPSRSDPAFAQIEQAWADAVFGRAERAATTETKRTLLERIANNANVDAGRRKRASDALVALDSEVVKVKGPPRARRRVVETPPPPAPVELAANDTTPTPAGAPARPTSPKKTPKATPKATASPAQAVTGSQKDAMAAKQALRAKVLAGTATDSEKRLLRVLCRQLGDASCSR